MDNLVHPIIAAEHRKLKSAATCASEALRRSIVKGSGPLALNHFEVSLPDSGQLANLIWTEMLRVIQAADLVLQPAELKAKFDSYMNLAVTQIHAATSDLGNFERYLPWETFDNQYEELLGKYHAEIDLLCTRLTLNTPRISIDEIDSFSKVREISAAAVLPILKNGYLDESEETIQRAFEEILSVSWHKKDWSGESNDLYTANLVVRHGRRMDTAFLLKGKGLRRSTLEIRDCGKNGDQLVRLVESPASFFIVQFVGNISESVIRDLAGKVNLLRTQGRQVHYCIIDGQDTARLLKGYQKP